MRVLALSSFVLHTMGNCINCLSHQPQEKIKVVIFNGVVQVFNASTPVEEITSGPYIGYKLVHYAQPYTPLPPNTKLEPGEVYHLVPDLALLRSKPLVSSNIVYQENYKRQKVKIVVTRKQLELLLESAKRFQSKEIGVRSSGSSGLQRPLKWRPSLATIPEMRSF